MNPLLQAALDADKAGWRIIPLHRVGGTQRMCSCQKGARCESAGKHPRWTAWQKHERLSTADIYATWDVEKPPNLGIVTGADSGFFVVDIDGDEALAALQALGTLAPTRCVRTGSGGWHLYYLMPDFPVGNSSAGLPAKVDIRGTGGQVVAPPSTSGRGEYILHTDRPVEPAPDWLLDLLRPKSEPPAPATGGAGPLDERSRRYLQSAFDSEVARLRAMQSAAVADDALETYTGEPWDQTTFKAACSLLELANAGLCSAEEAWRAFSEAAPRDPGFGPAEHLAKWRSAVQTIGRKAREVPAPSVDPLSSAYVAPSQPPAAGSPGVVELNVGNAADMADWLREEIGINALSGIFVRSGELVHTPAVGEEGYRSMTQDGQDDDGPAQVWPVTANNIVSRCQYLHRCVKYVKKKDDQGNETWEAVNAVFPQIAAQIAVNAVDLLKNVRQLRGVVHAPTLRADGSLFDTPGYDTRSGLLFLPDPRVQIPIVPEVPSAEDISRARAGLLYMIDDFNFVTPHDKANYLGLLLTPTLRAFIPGPYKLGAVEAPQPGSGKTYLARALSTINGGVFRSEMPHDDAELAKNLFSILDTTTGSTVVFDNVSGVLNSSRLAGLLTSSEHTDRRLGAGKSVTVQNDRLWVVTGNNLAIGGDLPRRTIRVRIDPATPDPHLRTGFKISDFGAWVQRNRGSLIWSLLVLARSWVVAGQPRPPLRSSDDYARWIQIVQGVLEHAGIEGTFNHVETAVELGAGADDVEWGDFLAAVHGHFGDQGWTAKELLSLVDEGYVTSPADQLLQAPRPLRFEILPSELLEKRRHNTPITQLSKSLGRWLTNRKGRWANGYTVREVGRDRNKIVLWRVERYETTSLEVV